MEVMPLNSVSNFVGWQKTGQVSLVFLNFQGKVNNGNQTQ